MNPPKSSSATPRAVADVVNDIYAAFARRDMARVFSLFSPEIEIVQSTQLPWGDVYRGHDGAREFMGKLTRRINSTVVVERLIIAGDRVVAMGWTRGTVNATGASYDVPIAHVWQIRDGAAVRVEFYIDHPTMLAALGARS